MNLLQLWDNLVCRDQILSSLDVNDLLRLRRVCQVTKTASEDFIRIKKVQTRRQLEVNFQDESELEEFNQFENVSYLPKMFRAILIFGQETSRLVRSTLWNLLRSHGSNITHLTVLNLEISFYSKRILGFFKSFPNVIHLVLDLKPDRGQRWNTTYNRSLEAGSAVPKKINVPPSFKSLKSLQILKVGSPAYNTGFCLVLVQLVEATVSNLEQLSIPFENLLMPVSFFWNAVCELLASKCLFTKSKLKLDGVHGSLIDMLLRSNNRNKEMGTVEAMINAMNERVLSVRHSLTWSFTHEIRNLKQIDVGFFNHREIPVSEVVKRDWPNLKIIRANLSGGNYLTTEYPERMWHILFRGIVRENVDSLDLHFDDDYPLFGIGETLPRTMDIVTSCPNLKILTIRCSTPKLVTLQELWRGLPLLEELYFITCNILKNEDFVGDNQEYPAFWSLKKLKVLKFEYTSSKDMTDDLFSQVLSHMPLKELVLSSGEDVASEFTLDGIKSLTAGIFACTVERLSIMQLAMKGVTMKEKKAVEKLFRSSQMI